jgi:lysozyme
MKPSVRDLLYKHLKWGEGYSEVAYPDSKGIPTIGIGHNLRARPLVGKWLAYYKQNNRLSKDLILELLDLDTATAISDAYKLFPNIEGNSDNRQVALIDLSYVLGYTKLHDTFGPTVAHINEGNWPEVVKHLEGTQWYKDVKRRGVRVCAYLLDG